MTIRVDTLEHLLLTLAKAQQQGSWTPVTVARKGMLSIGPQDRIRVRGWEPKQQRTVSEDHVLTLSAREGQHRHRKSCSTWAKAGVPQGGARMSGSISPYACGKAYPRDCRTLALTPTPPSTHTHSCPAFQEQACPLGRRTIPVCFRVHLTKCRAHGLPVTFAT